MWILSAGNTFKFGGSLFLRKLHFLPISNPTCRSVIVQRRPQPFNIHPDVGAREYFPLTLPST
jgi:hypothetical protein